MSLTPLILYQEGLQKMKNGGDMLGVPIYAFGPEEHMTSIVGMALGKTLGLEMNQ